MATSAGEIELGVAPDLTNFGSLLSSGVLKSLGPVESMIKSHLGLALGAGVALALGEIAKVSIGAFEEREKVLISLENTLSSMPKLAGETVGAFQDQAAALQDLTGVEDEQILTADQVLSRFNLTGDQIRELTPLVLDYAAKTGVDAPAAAQKLGLALLGNARALKLLGVRFTATGDITKDFNTLLPLVQARVGGLAEEMGQTLGGQMNILRANVNDLEETIGGVLVPILLTVAKVLNSTLGPALEFIGQNLGIIIPLMIAFGAALKIEAIVNGLSVAFGLLGKALLGVGLENAAFQMTNLSVALEEGTVAAAAFAGPLAAVTLGIGAGVLLVASLNDNMENLRQHWHDVALQQVADTNNVTDAVRMQLLQTGEVQNTTDALLATQGRFGGFIGTLTKAQKAANLDKIRAATDDYVSSLSDVEKKTAEAAITQDEFNAKLNETSNLQADLAARLGTSIVEIRNNVADGIAAVDKAIAAATKKFGSGTQEVITATNQAVHKWFQDQIGNARAYLDQWRTNAASSLNFVDDKVSEFLNKTHVSIDKLISSEKEALAQQRTFSSDLDTILKKGGDSAKEFVNWAIQQGPAAFGLVKSVAGASKKKMDEFIGTWTKAQGNADKMAQSLQQKVVGTLQDIRDILEEIVKKTWGLKFDSNAKPVIDGVKNDLRALQAYAAANPVTFNVDFRQTGDFPGRGGPHARGGPVEAGMSYLVGERGPELFVPSAPGKIVPNDQLQKARWNGKDGGVTVNVSLDRRRFLNEADYGFRYRGL